MNFSSMFLNLEIEMILRIPDEYFLRSRNLQNKIAFLENVFKFFFLYLKRALKKKKGTRQRHDRKK